MSQIQKVLLKCEAKLTLCFTLANLVMLEFKHQHTKMFLGIEFKGIADQHLHHLTSKILVQ